MPVIQSGKKLDLSDFFGEDAYITIKKLSQIDKIQIGYDVSHVKFFEGFEKVKNFDEQKKHYEDYITLLFEKGIDKNLHNFTDGEGKKISMTPDVALMTFDDETLVYVIEQIQNFSVGRQVGESNGKSLTKS